MKKKPAFTKIVYSCLTGVPVWLYRGSSENGCHLAYWRACKAEVERVKNWSKTVAARRAEIKKLLDNCVAALPINVELTKEQKTAIKKLQAMIAEPQPCDKEFYNHIMEEARRRNENSARWRETRKKNFGLKY